MRALRRAVLCVSVYLCFAQDVIAASTVEFEITISEADAEPQPVLLRGQKFQRLTFGEALPTKETIGLPDQPVLRRLVAVDPSQTYDVKVTYSNRVVYENILLAPIQPDHLETAPGALLALNEATYREKREFGGDAAVLEHPARIGPVTVAPIRIQMTRYNPGLRRLVVYRHARVRLTARGTARLVARGATLTRFQASQLQSLVLNAADVLPKSYSAGAPSVLVVTTATMMARAHQLEALHPGTTFRYVTASPTATSADVQDAIQSAYDQAAFDSLLLYGDDKIVPLAKQGMTPGDWPYVQLAGSDNYADARFGRLPVANDAEAAQLFAKLSRYRELQNGGQINRKILLLAHSEEYPGKYTANQEQVRTAPNPRDFTYVTQYGGAGATNATALNEINQGYGIVAYRGHGSASNWWNWDRDAKAFDTPEVSAMTNMDANLAVVFNIACDTGSLQNDARSLAERLLFNAATPDAGAVAVLAATQPSYTSQNNVFNREIFKSLETVDDISLGNLVALGNAKLVRDLGGGLAENVPMYVLLGDPDLVPWVKD